MRTLLLLKIAGSKFGIWEDEIKEAKDDLAVHSLPYNNQCIAGVARLSERFLSIADLSFCLGYSQMEGDKRIVLVMPGEKEVAGFVISGDFEKISCDSDSIYPVQKSAQSEIVDTCVVYQGELIPIINIVAFHQAVQGADFRLTNQDLKSGSFKGKTEEKKLHLVLCSGQIFAVRVTDCAEAFSQPNRLATVNQLPEFVNGLLLYQQEAVPLISLARKIRISEEGKNNIVLPAFIGDQCVCLLIEEDKGELEKGISSDSLPLLVHSNWLEDAVLYENEIVPIIDLELLFLPETESSVDSSDTETFKTTISFEPGSADVEMVELSLIGVKHALPKSEVVETLDIKRLTRIPNASPMVLGVVDHKNEILPVLDLAVCYGEISSVSTTWKMVLVQNGDFKAFVVTDRVFEPYTLKSDFQRNLPITLENQFVYGCYTNTQNDSVILILNVSNIAIYYKSKSSDEVLTIFAKKFDDSSDQLQEPKQEIKINLPGLPKKQKVEKLIKIEKIIEKTGVEEIIKEEDNEIDTFEANDSSTDQPPGEEVVEKTDEGDQEVVSEEKELEKEEGDQEVSSEEEGDQEAVGEEVIEGNADAVSLTGETEIKYSIADSEEVAGEEVAQMIDEKATLYEDDESTEEVAQMIDESKTDERDQEADSEEIEEENAESIADEFESDEADQEADGEEIEGVDTAEMIVADGEEIEDEEAAEKFADEPETDEVDQEEDSEEIEEKEDAESIIDEIETEEFDQEEEAETVSFAEEIETTELISGSEEVEEEEEEAVVPPTGDNDTDESDQDIVGEIAEEEIKNEESLKDVVEIDDIAAFTSPHTETVVEAPETGKIEESFEPKEPAEEDESTKIETVDQEPAEDRQESSDIEEVEDETEVTDDVETADDTKEPVEDPAMEIEYDTKELVEELAMEIEYDIKEPIEDPSTEIEYDIKGPEEDLAAEIEYDIKEPEDAPATKINYDIEESVEPPEPEITYDIDEPEEKPGVSEKISSEALYKETVVEEAKEPIEEVIGIVEVEEVEKTVEETKKHVHVVESIDVETIPPEEKKSKGKYFLAAAILLGLIVVYYFSPWNKQSKKYVENTEEFEKVEAVKSVAEKAEEPVKAESMLGIVEEVESTPVVAETTETIPPVKPPESEYETVNYVVKKGDYLFRITKNYTGDGYNYPKIQQENQILNPNLIYPDQVIKIKVKKKEE